MANHKSALKRIRSSEVKNIRNRYQHKTMRNALKKFRALTQADQAKEQMPRLVSIIDKLAKKSVIHKNKAANLKSQVMQKVNTLA